MLLAKVSTALTVIVGPILDSAGAEYASAIKDDLSISKNGGTLTALTTATSLTHIANGQYTLVLTTGNTDTLGVFQITCNKSTYQMPMLERQVVPATVYDAIVTLATTAAGGLGETFRVNGTSQTARDLGESVLLSPGTGAGQLDVTSGVVKANATQFAGQAITAAAGVTIPSSIASPTNITAGTITTATSLTNAPTAGDFTTTMKISIGTAVAASAVASVAGNVGGSVASVTAGVIVTTNTDKIGYSLAVAPPTASAISTQVASDLATAHGAGSWATATGFSTLDAAGIRTAVGMATANLDTQLAALAGYIDTEIGTLLTQTGAAAIRTAIGLGAANLDTQLSSIVTDTNELQTDWANGGRLDLIVDAVKAKTDQLAFTVANQVDANALTGGGGLDAAGVRGAVGLADANLDDQLTNIADVTDQFVFTTVNKVDATATATVDEAAIAAATAAEVIAGLTGVEVTLQSPITAGGLMTVLTGDDYSVAAGQTFDWSNSAWPVLTAGVVTFTGGGITKTLTIVSASAVRLLLADADTTGLVTGTYRYQVVAVLAGGDVRTLVNGSLVVVNQDGSKD